MSRESSEADASPLREVELLCPGLLGPLPFVPDPLPEVPHIARVLSRAERLSDRSSDPFALLLTASGLDWPDEADVPSGAIGLLGEGEDVDRDGVWMHADPVHLRPDRDRLLVFAGGGVGPDRAEADALVQAFNEHFVEEGLRLVAPAPGRWYLHAEHGLDLRTSPLHQAQEGSMAEHLPSGSDARDWMRLLNEAQMLFHAHEVNRRREATGRPLVSGIWTWGVGRLPSCSTSAPDALIGDGPLVRGLARLAGCRQCVLADWTPGVEAVSGRVVVFWERHWRALLERDLAAWFQALLELDVLLGGLLDELRRHGIRRLILDPGDGVAVSLSPGRLRRFWRRQGLQHFLSVESRT